MLLDRRETHRVVLGQLGHALVRVDRTADDVAPRGVGERAEHAVEVGRGNLHLIQPYGCMSRCQCEELRPANRVAEVGDPLALDDFRSVEKLRSGGELFEVARATAQDDRHQVEVDLVDQAELHALAGELSRG